MAIQMRRGNNAYYDESKMKPGEVAVATDTRQAYVGMGNGDAEELAFKRDLEGFGGGGGVNLLHNADWAYSLVNQRGHSGAVSDAYCIDRWIGDGSVTPTQGQYIAITAGTTMTQGMEIIPATLFGKKCTFSIEVNGTAQVVSLSFPASAAAAANTVSLACGTIELGFISGTFTLCGASCNAVPYVKFTASANINVRRVFLEFGDVSHMEETPPAKYGDVLADCQRFRLPLNRFVRYPITRVSSSEVDFIVPTPVTMRVAPTIDGELAVYAGTVLQENFTFTIAGTGPNAFGVRATKAGHGLGITDNLCLQAPAAALSADFIL